MLYEIDKQLLRPVRWGYKTAHAIGQNILYNAGRSVVLDRLVRQDTDRELDTLAAEISYLAVSKSCETEAVAELEALHHFAQVHAPKTRAELEAVSASDPPDPLAEKQLLHWLDERLPEPDPQPPLPRQGSL